MKSTSRYAVTTFASLFLVGGFALADGDAKAGHDHEAMTKAEKKVAAALSELPKDDQKLAKSQRFCVNLTHSRLGSMGTPMKVMVDGKPVFVCCPGCKAAAIKGGAKTVKTAEKLRDSTAVLAKLPMEERMAVESQKYCAIASTSLLGSMGAPIIYGKPVYLCCKGCTKKAQANPAQTLATAEKLKQAGHKGHKH